MAMPLRLLHNILREAVACSDATEVTAHYALLNFCATEVAAHVTYGERLPHH